LRGAWEPYTSHIQFIEAPFDKVAKDFSKWAATSQSGYDISRHTGSLVTLLPLLDPYWFPTKRLLVETRGKWTSVFSNGHDTYEAAVLSERLKVRSVVTDFSTDMVRAGEVRNYGGTSLEIFNRGRSIRTIHLSRQSSGWEWIVLGTELTFEDTNKYLARSKRDRFDIETLNRHCAALGIKRSDVTFCGPRALLHSEESTSMTHQIKSAAAWRTIHLDSAE
jgi:hypothetical protein